MGLIAQVRRSVERRRLLPGGAHVVVACSGGPDSTTLLHVLAALASAFSWRLTAAGVDHGLRAEAAGELDLVADHARSLGLPFERLKVAVEAGEGVQAGARRARYAALTALMRRLGAQALATGHTLDDQAETVLARLLRTPSVAGLAAIEPARGDGVVRPLIDCRRGDVLNFVQARGLRVARDPTNEDPSYTRVRVRERLLPTLEAENPRLVEHLAALADDARAHRQLVEQWAPALDPTEPGARERLWEQPLAVRRYLIRQWLWQQTGSEPKLEQVRALADAPDGESLVAGDRLARWRHDGALALEPRPKRTRGR